jgi:acyl-CoA dehydrogenase
MIFGQGAIRCHPFIVEEIEAAGMEDKDAAVKKFDGIFYRHIAHTGRNALRALVLGLSHGYLESAPTKGNIAKYYRQLSRFSAAYALMTDVTLLSIGGGLKARQRLSGRMADCLVHLYYASAVIKFWHEQDYPEDQRPIVEWCLQSSLRDLQNDMRELIINFPVSALRWPLRLLVFPLGAIGLNGPDDKLGTQIAMSIVEDTPLRELISHGCYINTKPNDSLGRVLNAYKLANETKEMRGRLHKAIGEKDPDDLDGIALLMGHERKELVDWACEKKIITNEESEKLLEALTALYDVLRVDAFDAEGIKKLAKGAKGKRKVVERGR